VFAINTPEVKGMNFMEFNEYLESYSDTMFQIECVKLKEKVKVGIAKKLLELPDHISQIFVNNCILSGGAIASIYHNEEPRDYDLWVKEDPTTIALIQNTLENDLMFQVTLLNRNDRGENYASLMVGNTYTSPNAVTLKNGIQFITLDVYQKARESFDYLHCLPYYDIKLNQFFISKNQWTSIVTKKLVSLNETESLLRKTKLVQRGWR
jgi:hypothetical protein